jgi:hypothetical protein
LNPVSGQLINVLQAQVNLTFKTSPNKAHPEKYFGSKTGHTSTLSKQNFWEISQRRDLWFQLCGYVL